MGHLKEQSIELELATGVVLVHPYCLEVICGKCGKPPIIEKVNSGLNWKVYDSKCECGGISRPILTA